MLFVPPAALLSPIAMAPVLVARELLPIARVSVALAVAFAVDSADPIAIAPIAVASAFRPTAIVSSWVACAALPSATEFSPLAVLAQPQRCYSGRLLRFGSRKRSSDCRPPRWRPQPPCCWLGTPRYWPPSRAAAGGRVAAEAKCRAKSPGGTRVGAAGHCGRAGRGAIGAARRGAVANELRRGRRRRETDGENQPERGDTGAQRRRSDGE